MTNHFILASGATSTLGHAAESLVVRLLLQLIVVLTVTRIVVAIAKRLGQTDVAGEILAGILLGPSLLGALAPEQMAALFHPSTSSVFVALAQTGLIFLMFQIGLEFEMRSGLASSRLAILVVSGVGIVVPFALGYFSAPWFYARLPETTLPSPIGFRLFFAIAMSITAIPILGRIFMELRLSHTRTAALTIGAAAIDDIVGWLLLGVVSLMISNQFSPSWLALRLLALAVYIGVVLFVVRPLLRRAIDKHIEKHGKLENSAIAWIIVALFVSATISSMIGVFAIIGGFVIGIALHEDRRFVEEWRNRVAPLVTTFLLPIFFAYTGLRTDVGSLGNAREAGIAALVCLVAFVGKFGGVYVGARAIGEEPRSALTIATCMNTRALMELVALNIGLDLGVLPRSMFTKLVLMAIVSTYMATPLIRHLMRGQERMEPAMSNSLAKVA